MVNIRVDDILRASIPPTKATTDANATPPVHNTASSPSSPPNDGATMCKPASVVPVSAPQGDGRQASGANEDMPCSDAPDLRSESRQARQSDRTNLPREHDFRDTEFSSSIRWRPHLDPRSSHHADGTFQQAEGNFDGYQGSSHTPTNPYYGSHDTRNETARSDPRRYDSQVPPSYNRRPQDVDVGYGSDDEAHLPQGGQIVSPRHWDCRQLAHSTGHSPLDAAALACREYHGYQRGYYPLTTTIIKSCGYRDARGDVSPYCNDIRVVDTWENRRTQQCGPSVDRILEKGLPVFPKLDSLDVSAPVNFYDKLQKTSALFLLPLMLFDAINLNMGFEGLCPPGLGLPQYAEIAGVLMEVLPRLLPDLDSQVTSLVTVVRAESNNGFDLLWRVLELAVPGFDPSLQISAPVWIGDDIFDFCLSYVLFFVYRQRRDSSTMSGPRASHFSKQFVNLHMLT